MKRFLFFSITALAALTFFIAPAMAEEAKVLSDQELAEVSASNSGDGNVAISGGNANAGGVQLNNNAQKHASALVLQNLNDSSSIVQLNIAVTFGGNLMGSQGNKVIHSQN